MDAMEFVVEKQLKSLLLDEDPTKIEFLHQKMMWNNWANGRQGMVMGAISGIDLGYPWKGSKPSCVQVAWTGKR